MTLKAFSQDQLVSPDSRCEYYTPKDVAIRLNLSIDMVYALLREEHIPAIRLGTGRRQLWRISIREFEFYLSTIRTGPLFADAGRLLRSKPQGNEALITFPPEATEDEEVDSDSDAAQ